jgi:hypothetical protein
MTRRPAALAAVTAGILALSLLTACSDDEDCESAAPAGQAVAAHLTVTGKGGGRGGHSGSKSSGKSKPGKPHSHHGSGRDDTCKDDD